jgi:hypothetical protein
MIWRLKSRADDRPTTLSRRLRHPDQLRRRERCRPVVLQEGQKFVPRRIAFRCCESLAISQYGAGQALMDVVNGKAAINSKCYRQRRAFAATMSRQSNRSLKTLAAGRRRSGRDGIEAPGFGWRILSAVGSATRRRGNTGWWPFLAEGWRLLVKARDFFDELRHVA